MTHSYSISIIIPTYQRTQYLFDTVFSILAQEKGNDELEISIIDNEPLENAEKSQFCKNNHLIYIHEPRPGLHNSRHTGARHAIGEILIYVDDDIRACDGWLEQIYQPFDDQRVAVVGGRVLPEWEIEPPEWMSLNHPGYLSLLDLGDDPKKLSWPEQVFGCNFAIRRSVLLEVGGFNPDSFADRRLRWYRGDGETGLLKKVYCAGYDVFYQPSACVFHRIPKNRLTKDYFLKRASNQAVSDGFSTRRTNRYQSERIESGSYDSEITTEKISKLKMLLKGILLGDASAWFFVRLKIVYSLVRLNYAVRFIFDAKLRVFVSQPNFMEKDSS